MKSKKFFYAICFFVIIMLLVTVNMLWNHSKEDPGNLLYFQETKLIDGTHIDLVHVEGCKFFDTTGWFVRKDNKIEYIKLKGQVFCFCIYEEECDMLIAISYRNAKKWYSWDFAYNTDNHDKSANLFAEAIDTVSLPHEVWFSESKDGRIIEQLQHKIYKQVLSNQQEKGRTAEDRPD